MRVVMFCHSLRSDWNHGNAHFLRGVVTELIERGNEVAVYEAHDSWSANNLVKEHGPRALDAYKEAYPPLESTVYDPRSLDLAAVLDGADLVLVHEWNEHDLVAEIGRYRAAAGRFTLLFHDTHHRSATAPASMAAYDLRDYDGVLAFGAAVRDQYLEHGWASQVFVWHEAADTRVFHPLEPEGDVQDVVWIGNWGDDERTAELREFLIDPIRHLRLRASVHGVRYPEHARAMLADAGIAYRGWLPNHRAPREFAHHKATVHVPRRPYANALPGIPTIRVFEALACGIPLICAPWQDAEQLFRPGEDYLVARNGAEMQRLLRDVLHDPTLAAQLATSGLQSIRDRHTCAHRVDELMGIVSVLSQPKPSEEMAA
jgi:spore maturation protein CgeB